MNTGGCFVYGLCLVDLGTVRTPNVAYLDEEEANKQMLIENAACDKGYYYEVKTIWVPHVNLYD